MAEEGTVRHAGDAYAFGHSNSEERRTALDAYLAAQRAAFVEALDLKSGTRCQWQYPELAGIHLPRQSWVMAPQAVEVLVGPAQQEPCVAAAGR